MSSQSSSHQCHRAKGQDWPTSRAAHYGGCNLSLWLPQQPSFMWSAEEVESQKNRNRPGTAIGRVLGEELRKENILTKVIPSVWDSGSLHCPSGMCYLLNNLYPNSSHQILQCGLRLLMLFHSIFFSLHSIQSKLCTDAWNAGQLSFSHPCKHTK